MTQVWERLFIGGIADAEELAEGNPHGIATVISLSEIPVATRCEGVNYLHIPIEDDEAVPVSHFDRSYDGAARLPINLGVPSEVDLHQHEVMFELWKEAENFAACHQFARGREDDADAKVFGVTLNLYAVRR
jgi:hypothetical protein